MRTRVLVLAGAILAACATPASAEEIATRSVTVNVNLATRTSLTVSSRVLQFAVTGSGDAATTALEFTAGARTAATGDVLLTVEPVRGMEGPGGAADADADLSFAGEGDGMQAGPVALSQSTTVARWQGSGLRAGRIVFTLRANAPGHYTLPVRVVLSAP